MGRGVERLYAGIAPLVESPKLGPLLWQLPENFHRDDDRLAAALEALPPGRHAFEFRHASWFCSAVFGLLHTHGAALVIGDDKRRPLPASPLTADWTLIRFHYGTRGRRGNYCERELREWADRIARAPAGGRGVRLLQQRLGGIRGPQRAPSAGAPGGLEATRGGASVNCPSDAGWSSQVARRAHNPKVAGSNPAPAIRRRRW